MESLESYHGSRPDEAWSVAEGEWGEDIRQRTFNYALRIIRLYRHLKKTGDDVGIVIGRQLLRSGTSIGANIAEARSAQSRADYTHKLNIALKEGRESLYWLQLLDASQVIGPGRVKELLSETDQIIAVLTSIIINLKKQH